jgi:hypothetical protein
MTSPGGESCQREGISVRHDDLFLLKFAPEQFKDR